MQFNKLKTNASPTCESRNVLIEMKNTNLWENLCPNDTQSFSIRTYKEEDLCLNTDKIINVTNLVFIDDVRLALFEKQSKMDQSSKFVLPSVP